ncbi:MAG: response regulator [Gammaproteobacteria bacterium]|nr:MAG: response regulator [Gammaproteobacteria bacterium]
MSLIRTIIAEDDPRIAEIQHRFLEKLEAFEAIGLALNLEDCREMINILEPDLILLDIYFPDGNGLEFLKTLRDENRNIDVILVTAARDVESVKSAMHGGVFDYIVKPLEFSRMRDSLSRYQDHFERLNALDTVEQSDIDGLLPRAVSDSAAKPAVNLLPKGIDALTLNKVRDLFQSVTDSQGAELVGQNIGISRTTARRYLEYLVSTNELVVDVTYGGVGRPERHYCRLQSK